MQPVLSGCATNYHSESRDSLEYGVTLVDIPSDTGDTALNRSSTAGQELHIGNLCHGPTPSSAGIKAGLTDIVADSAVTETSAKVVVVNPGEELQQASTRSTC